MSGVLIFLGGILFILAVAFSLYVRWWLGRAVNERPKVQVKVESDDTTTLVRLTTRGTRRQFRLLKLTAPRDSEGGASIGTPKGFRQTQISEVAVTWKPRRLIILPPAHPIDLRITHEPGNAVVVHGHAVSRLVFGGTRVECDILVRETDPERRTAFNRRSAGAAAAAEGLPPGSPRVNPRQQAT